MGETAVRAEGLGKCYRVRSAAGLVGQPGLRHALPNALAAVGRRLTGRRSDRAPAETFWALRDVSFDVPAGDCVAVIGRNGAGKSTLLKVLSRITEPTTGEVRIRGRVGSLLEVGTGFHLELTGRENIHLNGSVLGMSRREVRDRFDQIVAFSEVEKFLDTPVKWYSTGMYLRLAFAVAAHLDPEVLIVDEVLAVGDAQFQRKCLGKMGDVAKGGRTVLFVSHNMAAVTALCRSAVVLSGGTVVYRGEVTEAIRRYAALAAEAATAATEPNEHGIALRSMKILDPNTREPVADPVFCQKYLLEVSLDFRRPLDQGVVQVMISDEYGVLIGSMSTPEEGVEPGRLSGDVRCTFTIPSLALTPRGYVAGVLVGQPHDPIKYLDVEQALRFEVQPAIVNNGVWAYQGRHGYVRLAGGAEVIAAGPAD